MKSTFPRPRPGGAPATRLVALLVAVLLGSCLDLHPWREAAPPWNDASTAGSPQARVTLRDGSMVVLVNPEVRGESADARIVGTLPGAGSPRHEIPLERVAKLETDRFSRSRLLLDVLGWALVVTGAVLVLAAAATVQTLGV